MSASEVHAALARGENAGLYLPNKRKPSRAALQEFLAHGVRYAFAPERLGMTRGVPTAHSDPHGTVRGEGIEPLYRTAPQAALADERLYRLLALVDALRVGGARERRVTAELLDRELRA